MPLSAAHGDHRQLINLHSYATEQNAAACNFLDWKDPPFKPLHHIFNNHSKKLLSDGVGAKKKKRGLLRPKKRMHYGGKE